MLNAEPVIGLCMAYSRQFWYSAGTCPCSWTPATPCPAKLMVAYQCLPAAQCLCCSCGCWLCPKPLRRTGCMFSLFAGKPSGSAINGVSMHHAWSHDACFKKWAVLAALLGLLVCPSPQQHPVRLTVCLQTHACDISGARFAEVVSTSVTLGVSPLHQRSRSRAIRDLTLHMRTATSCSALHQRWRR
jgi:hypothetical protein